MIESIELEKCTGCGNCDAVCPADVIHMERVPAASPVAGVEEMRWLPVIRFSYISFPIRTASMAAMWLRIPALR